MIIHQVPLEDRIKKLEEDIVWIKFACTVLGVVCAILAVFVD